MSDIQELARRSPSLVEAYDATRPEFRTYVEEVASWYRGQAQPYARIDAGIRAALEPAGSIGLRTAVKIAESRRVIEALEAPVTVTLLNPVYKETGRMRRRSEHPHGEDSLRTKVEALAELERLNEHFHARMIVIDDECPDGSGELARGILAQYGDGEKYRVLMLGEAIDCEDPDLPPGLTHKDGPRRSVKGGSVLFGMRKCLRDPVPGRHILVDNDADLSIHPGQLGLLIEDIVAGSAQAVAGSRREEDSVATIGGSRNTRGQLFIQIWQHFLPQLAERIRDTNRAFKAFDSGALASILDDIQTYTFPYQIELLQACVSRDIPLSRRGIAYLDSEAASTQQGDNITETYLHQIHQILDIARRYETIPAGDELAAFFERISEDDWLGIERHPPERISDLV